MLPKMPGLTKGNDGIDGDAAPPTDEAPGAGENPFDAFSPEQVEQLQTAAEAAYAAGTLVLPEDDAAPEPDAGPAGDAEAPPSSGPPGTVPRGPDEATMAMMAGSAAAEIANYRTQLDGFIANAEAAEAAGDEDADPDALQKIADELDDLVEEANDAQAEAEAAAADEDIGKAAEAAKAAEEICAKALELFEEAQAMAPEPPPPEAPAPAGSTTARAAGSRPVGGAVPSVPAPKGPAGPARPAFAVWASRVRA